MYKQNLHTHSVFCDGKDPLEDIVLEAIAKGFDSVGFSSHSHTPFDESYCMSKHDVHEYVAECACLKQKYADKIAVFCGIEQDFYAPEPDFVPDFVIGSVHYVKVGDMYIPVDKSADIVANAVKSHFDGDAYAFAEQYYANVENLKKVTNCDIIGHFDLVMKFADVAPELFDENHPRYLAAADKALDALILQNVIFEINSGAVARGYRSTPYPSPRLLKRIADAKGKITLSSDCHEKSMLDCAYSDMISAARLAGFDEIYVLKGGRFEPEPIC